MPMKPEPGEAKNEFVSRCASEMSDAHPDWENDRVVAACQTMWGDKGKSLQTRQAKPAPDESRADFMARCIEEGGDEEECKLAWEGAGAKNGNGKPPPFAKDKRAKAADVFPEEDEEREDFLERCQGEGFDHEECVLAWSERKAGEVVHKTHASEIHGMEFVLSDATPDRMGDVIIANGWDLENFKKNPIALFNHKTDFPIGKWRGLRVVGEALRGHLELAPKGASPRIDEIRALIEADILKAVSVGFKPITSEPRKSGGEIFRKQELVETSLVSVPANPNALAIAKSLKISPRTLDLVFAKQGNKKNEVALTRGSNGKHAETPPTQKGRTMSPLTKRIEETQARIIRLREGLTTHLESVDDENVQDADLATTQEYNKKITDQESALSALKDSEARLAQTSDDGGTRTIVKTNGSGNGHGGLTTIRPFGLAPKKMQPIEYLVRAGTVRALARSLNQSIDDVRLKVYGDDDATRAICDLTLKAASAPAMTTVLGWAQELVQQINAEMMESLTPSAVYPSLSSMGLRLNFGRNGRISVPTRSATPTVAGSFVGEGAPIPVRQAAFTATTLIPKKMAVITTWTREMDEHSVPAIEGLLRNAIQEDTAVSIDSVLLDINPATNVRPAGLRNGVVGLTPTAGGGFNALVGDLKQLTGAILTATNGNIRQMVFIMNPQQALSIAYVQPPTPGGLFPFASDINNNRLNGSPVIKSGSVPLGTVICMDAADFVSVTGDTPRFEISDQATLHMEDTTPLQIASAGTPATVAAPSTSLFQTDSLALRLILPMNWAVRRTGVIAWVAGVTW